MIESLENKKVKEWTKLHRKKYRISSYITTDEETVRLAEKYGYLETLIYCSSPPFSFPGSVEVSSDVLYKLCGQYQGYCAVAGKVEERALSGDRVLLLDDLQDPLNIGILLHNARQFGFQTVILSEKSADIYHEKSLKESHGSFYELNIRRGDLAEELHQLKEKGYRTYATGLWRKTKNLSEVPPVEKMAFVLGNEGSGVCERVMASCDESVKIEMKNIDSLNVAVAGSLVMYRYRL